MARFFLIGFMGAGKSYWGSRWARKAGLPFYDLDEVIEDAAQMSIAQIFDSQGEEAFRRLESVQLKKFGQFNHFLLSCGGGTPCFFDHMAWMKSHGTVLYLRATPQSILNRVEPEIAKRPLLQSLDAAERIHFIEEKLKEREPVYLQATHVLDVETLHENTFQNEIEYA